MKAALSLSVDGITCLTNGMMGRKVALLITPVCLFWNRIFLLFLLENEMLSIGCNLDLLDESAKGWNCNNLAAIECFNIKMHYAKRQALVYNSWCKL
jgi:hypothetical protein